METKIYFASSVPAAFEVARRELGGEAVLIGSRPSAGEARQYGRLEVTFGWEPAREPVRVREGPQAVSDLDDIRRQLSALRKAVGRADSVRDDDFRDDSWVAEQLTASGFEATFAAELASAAVGQADPGAAVVAEMTRRIPVKPFGEFKPGEGRILAFIGSPGRGKTTSMIKIALKEGIAKHIPVRLFSAGAHAVGAQEQMARYAAILGVPHMSFESYASVNLALSGEPWRGLALIDTPGLSPADHAEMRELRTFLAEREDVEKHLVLRADARSADMLHVISRFADMKPSRLLFTGLDEAVSLAPAVETLVRSGIPGAFAGSGQQIPEDLREIRAAELARAVWQSGKSMAAVAA